jgi:hypothetical protein
MRPNHNMPQISPQARFSGALGNRCRGSTIARSRAST